MLLLQREEGTAGVSAALSRWAAAPWRAPAPRPEPPAGAAPSAAPLDVTPGGSIFAGVLAAVDVARGDDAPAAAVPVPAAVPGLSGVGPGGSTVPASSPTGGDAIIGRLADLFASAFQGGDDYRTAAPSAPLVLVGAGGGRAAAAGAGDAGPSAGRVVLGVVLLLALAAGGVVAWRKLRPAVGRAVSGVTGG